MNGPINPKDRVAFVVAIGLVVWGIITILAIAWRGQSLQPGGAEILLAVAGGLSASLAAYFATR